MMGVFLKGDFLWGDPSVLCDSVVGSVFVKKEFTVRFFFSKVDCQVKRRKTQEDLGRIPVIRKMTNGLESWHR